MELLCVRNKSTNAGYQAEPSSMGSGRNSVGEFGAVSFRTPGPVLTSEITPSPNGPLSVFVLGLDQQVEGKGALGSTSGPASTSTPRRTRQMHARELPKCHPGVGGRKSSQLRDGREEKSRGVPGEGC